MHVIKDPIQEFVNRIWNKSPGIGVRDLMSEVEKLVTEKELDIEVTKQRIKAAKHAIPYIRVLNKESDHNKVLEPHQVSFVERKIEERVSLRVLRRYKEADVITKGLTAMGIVLDDEFKTWSGGYRNINKEKNNEISQLVDSGVQCFTCGRSFASKNLVFKHLRDVSTSCGNAIFASNQKIPDAPSEIERQRKREAREAVRRQKTGKASQRADKDCSLWFGDLPIPWTRYGGQHKKLRVMLYRYLPKNVHTPWIKKIVRKGYRRVNEISGEEEYLGYAIIVFRDKQETLLTIKAMDSLYVNSNEVFRNDETQKLPSFELKVKAVESSGEEFPQHILPKYGGLHPPLSDQLRPLSIDDLKLRYTRLHSRLINEGKLDEFETTFNDKNDEDIKNIHDKLLSRVTTIYNVLDEPRKEVLHLGRTVPNHFCKNILGLLETLRWPAQNERKGLSSERYLVLPSNVTNDRFYGDLRHACRELMEWVDPNYFYSGIAVTKNFVSSPHIDDRDQSFQYAISLGDFSNGGELCVEGFDEDGVDFINVVETRNRIAKVDGRNVHWVKTWEYGTRYSLIFFDTTDRYRTDILRLGVDLGILDAR
jgi:hypothetical protein